MENNKDRAMKAFIVSLQVSLAFTILASCGTARRSEPLMGPMNITNEKVMRGEIVFNANCNKCHPGGEAGVGPAINNVYLPAPLLKFRVRSKAFVLGLGKMPSFKKKEITKQDLDALVAYLKKLRRNK